MASLTESGAPGADQPGGGNDSGVSGAGTPERRRRRITLKRVLIGVPLFLLFALIAFALTPLGRYLVRAGIAEASILLSRESIADLVASDETDAATKAKLQLVMEARSFAVETLGLDAAESFTQYTDLGRDTLVLVLSAAPQDRLAIHTWWFPLVGRLPYKGYFDFPKARDAARELAESGYDVNLRPAAAFSTLGWFNDPLLSTTLRADSVDLVDTVIHELVHNTYFASGQAAFNETFANFVGARGAALFFRMRGDTSSAKDSDARWADQQVLAQFWAALYRRLDSAFRAHPDDKARRLAVRDTIYTDARRLLVDSLSQHLLGVNPLYLERVPLNNASLLARQVYLTDVDLFEYFFEVNGRDIRAALTQILGLVREAESPLVELGRARTAGTAGAAGSPTKTAG